MSFKFKMSTVSIENVSQNSVDAFEVKEVGFICEPSTDSGLETLDSSSVTLSEATSCGTATTDGITALSIAETDNDSNTSFSSPISVSPEINDDTNVLVSFDDLPVTIEDVIDKENPELCTPVDQSLINSQNESEHEENADKNDSVTTNDISSPIIISKSLENDIKSVDKASSDLKSVQFENSLHNLASSSISLNDESNSVELKPTALQKAPFSRSAEDISIANHNITSASTENLNMEEILSEFSNQKSKVQAVQKIISDHAQSNVDNRYGRLQKELLNQDLGSIVKNVHGIFSSVSGSLKHAYNISHRGTTVKPAQKLNIPKPVPTNKLMSEIFEEESIDIQENDHGTHDIQPDSLKLLDKVTQSNKSDPKKEVYKLQMESLERLLAEQRKDMAVLKERMRQQTEELQQKDQMFKDLEGKMDLMRKTVETAEREKNSAVMKYASSECAVIEARRAADSAVRAERAALVEVELLQGKLRSAHAEKQRICQLYDDKCHELHTSERELSTVKEQLAETEGRLKWTQSKLRTEVDAYKESTSRVEKLTQRVTELEVSRDAAVVAAPDAIRARQLETELKESQAALILCKHESEELERRVSSLTTQLETCKRERDDAVDSLARINVEVAELRESKLRLEEEAASLASLAAKAAMADALTTQLERVRSRCEETTRRLSASEALADTCRRREAAALRHVAELTARTADHQGRAAVAAHQAQALSIDNASLRAELSSLRSEVTRLETCLSEETERRQRENRQLARKVAEQTEELSELTQKLEWEKGENGVLKKKHASAVKELNRELQKALKRCDQLEAKITNNHDDRAGSVSSLSSGENVAPSSGTQNGHVTDTMPDIQGPSPDKQALIERIVSLQRSLARRTERAEFLEEHCTQLTSELRNKGRLLRGLLYARADAANGDIDKKSELARLGCGGAMAAVRDPSSLTPELAQQIYGKLQAMLEDTLLTNITLKENVQTLGAEIARLKEKQKITTTCK